MKKVKMLLIVMAMLPTFAMAQTGIDKALEQLKRSGVEEISVSNETDIDDDGKRCVYEVYGYEVPKISSQFKKLLAAFDDEKKNAYSVNKRMKGASGEPLSIGYGKNAEKSKEFGTSTDRNYFMLFFQDPKDGLRRMCYVLTWYDSKMSSSSYTVYLTYIYSKDPKRIEKKTQSDDDRQTSITVRPDGTIIKMNRITGNTVVLHPQNADGKDSNKEVIKTGYDFIVAFNDLRSQYVRAVDFAGKDQTFFSEQIKKIVNSILELCHNHNKVLSVIEKNTCCSMLDDMKRNSRDKGVQEALGLAEKYVRGL